MRVETIYIAFDGTQFSNKYDSCKWICCKLYQAHKGTTR